MLGFIFSSLHLLVYCSSSSVKISCLGDLVLCLTALRCYNKDNMPQGTSNSFVWTSVSTMYN